MTWTGSARSHTRGDVRGRALWTEAVRTLFSLDGQAPGRTGHRIGVQGVGYGGAAALVLLRGGSGGGFSEEERGEQRVYGGVSGDYADLRSGFYSGDLFTSGRGVTNENR